MKITQTSIEGLKYVELDTWLDDRGPFVEAFSKKAWGALGVEFTPIQANLSKSDQAGIVRGMHWQDAPMAQGKIVFAMGGLVYDAVVDVRRESPTFGKAEGFRLLPFYNALFIAKGLAHGYQALEAGAGLMYLVDAPYSPSHERGLRYDDPDAGIRWPTPAIGMAPKDLRWPTLKEIRNAR